MTRIHRCRIAESEKVGYNGAIHAKHCDGQRTYSANRIEEAVLTIVKEYFRHFNDAVDAVWQEQVKLQLRRNQNQRMAEAQHKLESLQKQKKNLKQEILKSMAGESAFDQNVIREMFEENTQAIANVQQEIERIEQEKNEADCRLMVDNADTLIAIYNGDSKGGTAYTVRYAQEGGKEIVIFNPEDLTRRVIHPSE